MIQKADLQPISVISRELEKAAGAIHRDELPVRVSSESTICRNLGRRAGKGRKSMKRRQRGGILAGASPSRLSERADQGGGRAGVSRSQQAVTNCYGRVRWAFCKFRSIPSAFWLKSASSQGTPQSPLFGLSVMFRVF